MHDDVVKMQTDVLVIGGGLAGCMAAIAAAKQGQEVVLVDKAWTGGTGASTFATGGFLWFDPARHSIQDILHNYSRDGGYMLNPEWLEWFCHNVHECIHKLDAWGMPFNKDAEGKLVILPSRGGTEVVVAPGYKLQKCLRDEVKKASVRLVDRVSITRLLQEDARVTGAVGFNVRTGQYTVFEAKNTVMAAGGCSYKGNFFGQDMLCGEGINLALQVGAEFTNMEFSNVYNTSSKDFDLYGISLLSKFGGRFVNSSGEYFMDRYDAVQKDNAHLSVLQRSMASEVRDGRGPIYFDLRGIDTEKRALIRQTIPMFFEAFESKGVDPFEKPLEWVPAFVGAASCGSGLTLRSFSCDTTVPGLYAAGDVANQGLIMGCLSGPGGINLSWALVTGWSAGEAAAMAAASIGSTPVASQATIDAALAMTSAKLGKNGSMSMDDAVLGIQSLVIPAKYNILRSGEALREALEKLDILERDIERNISVRDTHELMSYHELPGMLVTAKMTFLCALLREETRGSQFREDFPETDNTRWLVWTKTRMENGKLVISTEPIPFAAFERYGLEVPQGN